MTSSGSRRVLFLIICAAPPCANIVELIDLLHAEDWDVYAIATPTAMTWIPQDQVEQRIGRPVLNRQRRPGEPRRHPDAEAIAVVPATFNTINAWAAGINNTLPLAILNESLGTDVPIVASVYAKPALVSHPAFAGNLRLLRDAGVLFTDVEALRPADPRDPFLWQSVIDLLRTIPPIGK
ncbi:flavoprotein [Actinoplanes sp. L3-i22]|uniref:flavoprotein n=1 Tax=Actinoplanes sp. L3-i22 TaxID=2836373 RepID=UPI001C762917|nr:flavoprotein [Actinoplanes sp. L3-i22]BCY11062.1 flavoprotein [Actinoplanes sp. L3-i22]